MATEMITATSKYVRVSPRKVAMTLNLVRGKSYTEAERVLSFTNTKASSVILKTLKSAGANAHTNNSLKTADLVVTKAVSHGGPLVKRGRIVGRGRFSPILKRSAHIEIGLRSKDQI